MNTDTRREVVDQTIISTELPALKITVAPAFQYMGILRFVLKEIALVERVIFVEQEGSEVTRLFIVQFEGALEGVDFTYKYGIVNPIRLGQHDYHHNVYLYSNAEEIRENPGTESEQTTQFLQDRGLVFSDELAMSRFARIVDDARRHEIIIFYQETMKSLGLTLDAYNKFPTEEQLAFDRALTERSLGHFQVSDP